MRSKKEKSNKIKREAKQTTTKKPPLLLKIKGSGEVKLIGPRVRDRFFSKMIP